MAGKKISVVIPCYNEEENIVQIVDAVKSEFQNSLPEYNYDILIIDNCSTDNTRQLIRDICADNSDVKAIFNAKNFGQFNSPYYALLQTDGDAVIPICADFQDPVEMIPQFVKEWESGYKIVCGIKTASEENKVIRFLRTCYYKLINKMSQFDMIEHFTGFALYDKSFIEVLRKIEDPNPFLRGIVAEYGYQRKDIAFTQPQRRAGKTHNGFYSLYDAAMLSFTSYTKAGPRIATFAGLGIGILGFLIGLIHLIVSAVSNVYWYESIVPVMALIIFIGGIQLFFVGIIGEYVVASNMRNVKKPLVVEEERINFHGEE